MDTLSVFTKKTFKARGLLLGERLDLRALGKAERLADAPLTISVRGGGVAVLFDVTPSEQAAKPDLIWDRPDLERLFLRLEDEYEISERYAALNQKLELISRTAETVLELLQHRRGMRVEWYIVILIVLEILLTLYQRLPVKPVPDGTG
jgi:hypothetical protein